MPLTLSQAKSEFVPYIDVDVPGFSDSFRLYVPGLKETLGISALFDSAADEKGDIDVTENIDVFAPLIANCLRGDFATDEGIQFLKDNDIIVVHLLPSLTKLLTPASSSDESPEDAAKNE